ncbi:DNA starvation/stationary phase protection protein [Porphyromonadaceae bacterium OttesenSCG-928-L07]|nr:DNA starvation/stationary phase protection protein [Porphyromonadaceae bacterium OttesenSCG-928-L07]MDL2251892.1 DNA starvation/stationary phase protection protein [Odoribacter sp. OttesenSCG-928-J03]MDL2283379.1 DNA starvation/stationary phase protection protein [Odoribacter sp. OttesenSCG-928-G04]
MTTNIGLEKGVTKASKAVLDNLLSDHVALMVKMWNYHWNVKGPNFHSYHEFIEELYTEVTSDIDEIAERIRSIDERPVGSMKGFLAHNRIKEQAEDKELPDAITMLSNLNADIETMIREIRKDIETLENEKSNDAGTLSFLDGMLEKKEKTAWMLRSFISK